MEAALIGDLSGNPVEVLLRLNGLTLDDCPWLRPWADWCNEPVEVKMSLPMGMGEQQRLTPANEGTGAASVEHFPGIGKARGLSEDEALKQEMEYLRGGMDRVVTPRTVTLVGSTRFIEDFKRKNKQLSLMGYVVYSVAFSTTAESSQSDKVEEVISPHAKLMLDAVHMAKIANSQRVHVLNIGGYVGESTTREIYFAHVLGKEITWEAAFVEIEGRRFDPLTAVFWERLGFYPGMGRS